MKLTVRSLLSIPVLMMSLSLGVANAVTLKISTQYPDGNAVLSELKAAADTVKQRTEGRVEFKFYPGGVMGDDQAVQRKIRIGQLHGALIQGGALADAYRDAQVLNAPLLFRDYEEVDAVRAELGDEIEAGLAANGWQTYGLIEAGFAYGMSRQPITSLDSLKQQKLWLPANDALSEQIARAFDIDPIVLNIGDVLTALQTGAIDAIVAPPVGAITLQWYSRLDYLTDAPFMYTYGVLALSDRALRGVGETDRSIIDAQLRDASGTIDRLTRADNVKALAAMPTLGVEIVEPSPVERAALEQEADLATQALIEQGQFSREIYLRVMDILADTRAAQ